MAFPKTYRAAYNDLRLERRDPHTSVHRAARNLS